MQRRQGWGSPAGGGQSGGRLHNLWLQKGGPALRISREALAPIPYGPEGRRRLFGPCGRSSHADLYKGVLVRGEGRAELVEVDRFHDGASGQHRQRRQRRHRL